VFYGDISQLKPLQRLIGDWKAETTPLLTLEMAELNGFVLPDASRQRLYGWR